MLLDLFNPAHANNSWSGVRTDNWSDVGDDQWRVTFDVGKHGDQSHCIIRGTVNDGESLKG